MSQKLTSNQHKALRVLLAGDDQHQAATAAGVSTRTINRWLEKPAFYDELTRRKTQAIDAASVRLVGGMDKAIGVMLRIMGDDQAAASIRLRAANSYLGHALRYLELNDVIARIDALEQRVGQ